MIEPISQSLRPAGRLSLGLLIGLVLLSAASARAGPLDDWRHAREAEFIHWSADHPAMEGELAAVKRRTQALIQQFRAPRAAEFYQQLAQQHQAQAPDLLEQARQFFETGFNLRQSGDLAASELAFQQGLQIDPGNPDANFFYADLLSRKGDGDTARDYLLRAAALGGTSGSGLKAQAALTALDSRPNGLGPRQGIWSVTGGIGEVWDCPYCPKMTVIPAGEFQMGSSDGEAGRQADEGPVHRVAIDSPFAVGKYDVTYNEWDTCVADGGCGGWRPPDRAWGRGALPVTDVSWRDAEAYVRWLSEKTGKPYRLLTEAEWEYAARAGSATPFYAGERITTSQADFDGTVPIGGGIRGDYLKRPTEVGSYPANKFGLFDMMGNVWQWTADCYQPDYAGASGDGHAVAAEGCPEYVMRGGSWFTYERYLRSANRMGADRDERIYVNGFRVARDF